MLITSLVSSPLVSNPVFIKLGTRKRLHLPSSTPPFSAEAPNLAVPSHISTVTLPCGCPVWPKPLTIVSGHILQEFLQVAGRHPRKCLWLYAKCLPFEVPLAECKVSSFHWKPLFCVGLRPSTCTERWVTAE